MTTTPTISVSYDATLLAYASASGLEYDPRVHRVLPNHPFGVMVRRVTRNPKLLLYFHRLERTYVLGEWLHEPKAGRGPGLINELEIFEGPPNWKPADVKARLSTAWGAHKALQRDLLERSRERTHRINENENRRYEEAVKAGQRFGLGAANAMMKMPIQVFGEIKQEEREAYREFLKGGFKGVRKR